MVKFAWQISYPPPLQMGGLWSKNELTKTALAAKVAIIFFKCFLVLVRWKIKTDGQILWHHIRVYTGRHNKSLQQYVGRCVFFSWWNLLPSYSLHSQEDDTILFSLLREELAVFMPGYLLLVMNLQSRDWGYSVGLQGFNSKLAKRG